MSIETPEELEALKAAGRVVADALRAMRRAVRPGVTTGELDQIGARVFRRARARSGPQLDYGFPGTNCISVNDEAVHGIPGRRRLRDGDLVKLDVTAELDGYYADACISVPVGRPTSQAQRLVGVATGALTRALEAATANRKLNEIGLTVQREVHRHGLTVCHELMGHGIGRRIHESPDVPNFYVPSLTQRLHAGLVITIEPIITSGSGAVKQGEDGWTIRTADGAPSAHVEHTIVITDADPIVLTG